LGEQIFKLCQNNSGSLIPKGSVVRQTGFDSITQRPTIALGSASDLLSAIVFGVADEDVLDGTAGSILIEGSRVFDTTGFSIGGSVFLSNTLGGMSSIPGTISRTVGTVLSVGTNGAIFIRGILSNSGSSGGTVGLLAWEVGTTWSDIYSQITSSGSNGIILVYPDSVPRVITAGVTNLDNVFFYGVPIFPDTSVAIDMNEGVVLGPGGGLRSQDITWRSLATGTRLIGSGPPCSFEFNGGGLIGWTDPSAFNPIRLDPGGNQIRLLNGATLSGSGMPPGNPLVVVSGGGSLSIQALARATVGDHTVGGGVFASVTLSYDASTTVDPSWVAGFIGATSVLLDVASRVSYDDSLVAPTLGTDNIQGAIDTLKGGFLSLLADENADGSAGIATLDITGNVVVSNLSVTATTKFLLTVQDSGSAPTGFIYQSARTIGTNFTITSTAGAADVGVQVYYQLWEPAV
jgi:hypothetical protein